MATLRQTVDLFYKSPTVQVKVNGKKINDVLSVETQASIEDTLASCTINTIIDPRLDPEAKITLEQGYDGKQKLTFTGYVDEVDYDEYEETYVISCRDVLKKAMDTFFVQEVAFGIDVEEGRYFYSTYSNIDGGTFTIHEYGSLSALNASHPETTGNYTEEGVKAEAVVQWLMVMCGFAEGKEIQVDSTEFFIGDLKPARFHLTSAYDAAMQIANLIGWRLFADESGVVRFKKRPRNYSGYTQWKYKTRGEPYSVFKVKKTKSNTDLRNYVEIHGASGITSVRRASSPYIGNTPYRGVLISNELIDTQGMADYMARRVLADLNRLKETITLEGDGNPFIFPGDTIEVNSRVATGKWLVSSHATAMSADGGYTSNLEAIRFAGELEDEEEPTAEIVADFTALQTILVGDPRYIVQFDASASYSNRGDIVQYQWNWPDGTTEITADPQVWFVFQDINIMNGNSQDVTLTVTDELGYTGMTTSGITLSGLLNGQEIKYRHLYGALTTLAVGSLDGGQLWNQSSIPAISVAASNFGDNSVTLASGYALFGTSDNKIYKTTDGAATVVLKFTATAPINHVSVEEYNWNYALAGAADGKLYKSTTQGETWSLIHDFPFPINEARFGANNPQYILVVGSGQGNVYESFDNGVSFTKIVELAPYIVNRESSGAFSNYYATTVGVVKTGPSGGVVPGSTDSFAAISIMIDRDDGIMGVSTAGQHYVGASGMLNATQNNSTNTTNHNLRDGEIPILAYFATQSGISKSLNRNNTIQELFYPTGSMPGTGWGKMVAYGPLVSPPKPPGRLVLSAFQGVVNSFAISGGYPAGGTGLYLDAGSEWVSVFSNGTHFGLENVKPVAGRVVFVHGDSDFDPPNSLSWFQLVPSGMPVMHVGAWVTDGYSIVSPIVSRRPGVLNRKIFINEKLSDLGQGQIRIISDLFTDNPQAGDPVELPFRVEYFPQRPRANEDKFVYVLWPNLFASPIVKEMDFGGEIPVRGDDIFTLGSNSAEHNVLSPMNYRYGAIYTASDPNGLFISEGVGAENQRELVLPNGHQPSYIHDSVIAKDHILYATTSGVWRTTTYGQSGVSDMLLAIPSGYHVGTMNVTHDQMNTTDYIAVVAQPNNEESSNLDHVYYTNDSGVTWNRGPDINRGLADYLPHVFYVEHLTTS